MEVKIKKTNVELTPDVAAYLDKKLQAFEKFIGDDPTAICEVELGKTTKHHQTGNIFFAEITLTGAGSQFRVVSEEGTLMAAIDKAKDALLLELGKSKKRMLTLSRHAGAAVKAMQRGLEFATDLPRRSVKLARWGKDEFRGYWPFRKDSE